VQGCDAFHALLSLVISIFLFGRNSTKPDLSASIYAQTFEMIIPIRASDREND
jgi:hypothetical protein